MKLLGCLSLLPFLHFVRSHGGHGAKEGETIQQYAQRHMSKEHHIDSFDLRSFFQLHDLNRDGFWDRDEIEAIYGVHHVYSKQKTPDEAEHQKKATHISNSVLLLLDKNRDDKVSPEEFEAVGLDGLPNFEGMGADGHHYDVESEFFLHHEEEFHSTPETQTDESYHHPEDFEHFAQHESIERKEAEREAKFQGITVEEALASHEEHAGEGSSPGPGVVPVPQYGSQEPLKPKITRPTPPEKQDPRIKYQDATKEKDTQSEWGTGEEGYKSPKSPAEKLRKNLPYKYKFRRNWGDF